MFFTKSSMEFGVQFRLVIVVNPILISSHPISIQGRGAKLHESVLPCIQTCMDQFPLILVGQQCSVVFDTRLKILL